MHALKVYVDDSVFDKVMYFLKNLPINEVKVVEENVPAHNTEDFIGHLLENPIRVDGSVTFLSRDEANAR